MVIDETAILEKLEGYEKKEDRRDFRRGYRELRKTNVHPSSMGPSYSVELEKITKEFKDLSPDDNPYKIGRALGLASNLLEKGGINDALKLYRKAGFIKSDFILAKLVKRLGTEKGSERIRFLTGEIRKLLEERKAVK